MAVGSTVGAWFGGGSGLALGSVTGPGAVLAAAGGATVGAGAGAAIGVGIAGVLDAGINVFSKSHTVGQTDIGGHGTVRVDWNEPRGNRPGDVHVQGEGFYQKVEGLGDLRSLPKKIRNNADIKKWVEKGIRMLEEFNRGN